MLHFLISSLAHPSRTAPAPSSAPPSSAGCCTPAASQGKDAFLSCLSEGPERGLCDQKNPVAGRRVAVSSHSITFPRCVESSLTYCKHGNLAPCWERWLWGKHFYSCLRSSTARLCLSTCLTILTSMADKMCFKSHLTFSTGSNSMQAPAVLQSTVSFARGAAQ